MIFFVLSQIKRRCIKFRLPIFKTWSHFFDQLWWGFKSSLWYTTVEIFSCHFKRFLQLGPWPLLDIPRFSWRKQDRLTRCHMWWPPSARRSYTNYAKRKPPGLKMTGSAKTSSTLCMIRCEFHLAIATRSISSPSSQWRLCPSRCLRMIQAAIDPRNGTSSTLGQWFLQLSHWANNTSGRILISLYFYRHQMVGVPVKSVYHSLSITG